MLPRSLMAFSVCWTIAGSSFDVQGPDPLDEGGGFSFPGRIRTLRRRQLPWYLPQAFPGLPLVVQTGSRDSWRYGWPCRPPYPSYPPHTKPSPPTSTVQPEEPATTASPATTPGQEKPPREEPTRCTWAIVACCSPGSKDIRFSCFELLGCPGAFWDVNPCDMKSVMAAANVALQFYEDKAPEVPEGGTTDDLEV